MAGRIEATLAELGITLPRPMQPIANYVPYVVTGNLVVVSGQVPAIDGKIAITGKVSWGVSLDQAKEAARLCFINVLVHLKAACGGDLDRVNRRQHTDIAPIRHVAGGGQLYLFHRINGAGVLPLLFNGHREGRSAPGTF